MHRREFLKRSAQAAISWTILSAAPLRGANARLRIGVIGCGARGGFDARLMRGDVEIAALCDVDKSRIAVAQSWAPRAKVYPDFRRLLDDREIDAVIVATPGRWRARMAILACEAGKDVYLQAPVIYRLAEGKALREAVRRTKRIVQTGAPSHSAGHLMEAAQIVRGGRIGQVRFVRAGSCGVHAFHTVHQAMGADAPLTVSASGRQATFEYPTFVMSWERDRPGGVAFYGTEAALFVDAAGVAVYPQSRAAANPTPLPPEHFVDNVLARKEPAANIDAGVRAAAIAGIANIALRTGRKLAWDDAQWRFPGDAEANRLLMEPLPWGPDAELMHDFGCAA